MYFQNFICFVFIILASAKFAVKIALFFCFWLNNISYLYFVLASPSVSFLIYCYKFLTHFILKKLNAKSHNFVESLEKIIRIMIMPVRFVSIGDVISVL